MTDEDASLNLEKPILSTNKTIQWNACIRCRSMAKEIITQVKFKLGGRDIQWIPNNKESSNQERQLQ